MNFEKKKKNSKAKLLRRKKKKFARREWKREGKYEFWNCGRRIDGKEIGQRVQKAYRVHDFRFEMMITERIALSFFVRQWRPLSPPRGVGSRVCMQRNVHACTPRTWCTFRTYLYVLAGIYRLRTPRPAKRILLCSPMNVQPRDHRVSLPSGPLHLNCVDREVLNLATGNCFLLSSFPSFSIRIYTI